MIWFLDFEASSPLPGGFPIEVAWVDMNGQGESHLIRPADDWLDRGYGWSHQSEAVHGISLETLMQDGEVPEQVARRAADVLSVAGVIVCSDATSYEGGWMGTLLDEGGERRVVRMTDVRQLYRVACRPLLSLLSADDERLPGRAEEGIWNMATDIIARAREEEHLRPRIRHRELPDAEGLWWTWRSVQDAVARHVAAGG